MHDALRQRLLRRIESLPDEQVYQVLDFIEFLESKYAGSAEVQASGLQRFAESLEDKLRKKAVSPNTIREAFQLISAADRVLGALKEAGIQATFHYIPLHDSPFGRAHLAEGSSPLLSTLRFFWYDLSRKKNITANSVMPKSQGKKLEAII